jgi:hypothetical protein
MNGGTLYANLTVTANKPNLTSHPLFLKLIYGIALISNLMPFSQSTFVELDYCKDDGKHPL